MGGDAVESWVLWRFCYLYLRSVSGLFLLERFIKRWEWRLTGDAILRRGG
jgi:hypothetical protein